MVPLGRRVGALLAGQAARPTTRVRPVGHHGRAVDAEHVAVAGVVGGLDAVHHLHLDAAGEGLSPRRQRIAPEEQARVTARRHVPVLELQHEVLVLPVGAQHADGSAAAHDHAVAHGEGVGGAVHPLPAGQVGAVEQRPPVEVGLGRRGVRGAVRHRDEGPLELRREPGCPGQRGHQQRRDPAPRRRDRPQAVPHRRPPRAPPGHAHSSRHVTAPAGRSAARGRPCRP